MHLQKPASFDYMQVRQTSVSPTDTEQLGHTQLQIELLNMPILVTFPSAAYLVEYLRT